MPSGASVILGGNWNGLRRDEAPYSLRDESPATTDAANYNDIERAIGPRRGTVRRSNQNSNLLGVIPFTFPFTAGRILSDDTGAWTAVTAPAPPGPNVPVPVGAVITYITSANCVGGVFTNVTQTETFDANGNLIGVM